MPRVLPFNGIHFDFHRTPLGAALCPPYDVIPEPLARRLRRRPHNTIHLELPAGRTAARYRRAANLWRSWDRDGALVRDAAPAYYVIEQRFVRNGRKFARTGILAALGLDAAGLRHVIRHEKTLSKPKKDRRKLLAALRVNTSPIFTIYPDSGGTVRRLLAPVVRARPLARGRAVDGVDVRLWRLEEPRRVRALAAALRAKTLLVADGHHRLEVARGRGEDSILCYLCAEEDRGLVVLPTHRVLAESGDALGRIQKTCGVRPMPSLGRLERALERHPSPFSFGLASEEGLALAVPAKATTRGVRSRLGVEWLAKRLLASGDPQRIRYTHASREAVAWARRNGSLALLVKPVSVRDIRRAVTRVGLLPQKSTYFYPKIEAGIVFKEAA